MKDMMGIEYPVDLGSDHWAHYMRWAPEDLPANRERYGMPLPVVEKCGMAILHPNLGKPQPKYERMTFPGPWCVSAIHFDLPETKPVFPTATVWQVESWDPLTLSPSVLCLLCGDHGHIKEGRWKVA